MTINAKTKVINANLSVRLIPPSMTDVRCFRRNSRGRSRAREVGREGSSTHPLLCTSRIHCSRALLSTLALVKLINPRSRQGRTVPRVKSINCINKLNPMIVWRASSFLPTRAAQRFWTPALSPSPGFSRPPAAGYPFLCPPLPVRPHLIPKRRDPRAQGTTWRAEWSSSGLNYRLTALGREKSKSSILP